ncbi:hypothetical protein [Aquimarina algiphila]|uniref:Deoxyuridine 5'-triphosphate nucleotidohydrolase n=1 Tax=Aquimarina algiphila TaxID=2047982 RepID=A0A554VHH5_9FLAO|nr:hypothetical protein [Aquimarina algiphila]TSE06966.1 hypothetical protein FOF46_17230 [Aquimarina algiphila]
MKFDKDFKKAISHLPSDEKDKLILRLLKKDLNLANRLYFELLDDRTAEDKRQVIEKRILSRIEHFSKYDSTPGYLMMYIRDLSGEITEHVKVTKDKYGEVSLNLLMLMHTLTLKNRDVLSYTHGKARKFCLYIIARAFKILILIQKLHEDLWMEFYDDLEELGQLISENDYLMKTAIQNGFDVNWLINKEIPEDIEQIHRDIRNQGYLSGSVYLRDAGYTRKIK